jgi:hypothetical protein
MWALAELVVFVLQMLSLMPRDPGSPAKVNEAMSRRLEPFRWLIYGVILFGVAMLACAGIALLFTP